MKYMRNQLYVTICCLLLLAFTGCEDKQQIPASSTASPKIIPVLHIVSGSENKTLEPIIQQFAHQQGVDIRINYQGSVDMMLMLRTQGANMPYDAIWPANSLWLALGDEKHQVTQARSIMRTPVVLGVRKSLAQKLGWDKKDVRIADILKATQEGKLSFAMTSATQSNSGASAYLGFLHALSGKTTALQAQDLDNIDLQQQVRHLLAGISRSSGSSGWLKDALIQHYERFSAMFNYEALIIEANQALLAQGKEPLFVVYPVDGILIADSPLAYIDKGDASKTELFTALQNYLLSDAIQQQILAQGRRTSLVGMNPNTVNKAVFNPDWGIDITRIISPAPLPASDVIRKALYLYQTALRKPSCTAYVVDVSGSMQGTGLPQLKDALSLLFDINTADKYMLQASPDDIHIILPFNSGPKQAIVAHGNKAETMQKLLTFVQGLQAGGGTNIYIATITALESMNKIKGLGENYFPAIILMTDGRSEAGLEELQATMSKLPLGYDIPIHAITFGKADPSQLDAIAEISVGRVFSGHDLIHAFRKAKGYN
ncbi:MAG: substrate-binding and VWA domain-containing protein [Mariprofundales bacterium]